MSDQDFSITVTEDKMFAYLQAKNSETKLDAREVVDEMDRMGISFGIRKAIFISFKTLNDALKDSPKLEIARGVGPKKGKPAELYFYFDKDREPGKPFIDATGRAHHRKLSYVDNIAAGDLLLEKRFARKGYDGKNVFDEPIPSETGDDTVVEITDNVEIKSDSENDFIKYYAKVSGMPCYKDGVLSVETLVHVDRNIDYAVGDITFYGDIVIDGSVNRGFTVEGWNDVNIGGEVDFATVRAGRNLKISGSVVTGKENSVSAKNDISVKFLENSKIVAGNDINVENWIMHSFLHCKGKLVLGDEKGYIVGGRIEAGISVDAQEIGSHANVETTIIVKYNDSYYKDNDLIDYYTSLRRRIYLFKDEINKSYELIENVKESEKMDFTQKALLIEKIGEKIYDKREQLVKDEEEENSFKEFLVENGYVLYPQVIVRDKIYPGVELILGETVFKIRKEYERVKFYLEDDVIKLERL